jgi:hypothetical protein
VSGAEGDKATALPGSARSMNSSGKTDARRSFVLGIAILLRLNAPARSGGLQLDDCTSDPLPKGLLVEIAAFELGTKVQSAAHEGGTHQVETTGGSNLGLTAVLPYQQVRGPPDVKV